jgi:hypothetical protein
MTRKTALTSLALAATLALAAGSANSALKLTTAASEANAYLTIGTEGMGQSGLVNVTIAASANSNATLVGVTPTVDEASGLSYDLPTFKFPVTSTQIVIGSGGKLIKPIDGTVSRSALTFSRPGGRGEPLKKVAIGNFTTDFVTNVLTGDIMTATETLTGVKIFTFTNDNNTKVALKGFDVVTTGTVSRMTFVNEAADKIGDALSIASGLRPSLKQADWGKVSIDVSIVKRRTGGKVNATPITATDIGL